MDETRRTLNIPRDGWLGPSVLVFRSHYSAGVGSRQVGEIHLHGKGGKRSSLSSVFVSSLSWTWTLLGKKICGFLVEGLMFLQRPIVRDATDDVLFALRSFRDACRKDEIALEVFGLAYCFGYRSSVEIRFFEWLSCLNLVRMWFLTGFQPDARMYFI